MIQQFKGTLTKDEYYAKIKEQKINNINCGKKLKKINTIHIDEESGNISTIFNHFGIKENRKYCAISNKDMGEISRILHPNTEKFRIYHDEKGDEFTQIVLDDLENTKIYDVDCLFVSPRAHCYSAGSYYYNDLSAKMNHIIHYVGKLIHSCDNPLTVVVEIAGDLKNLGNTTTIKAIFNKLGYNLYILPVVPVMFDLPINQRRVVLVAIHNNLNFKSDYDYKKYQLDTICDFQNFKFDDNLVANRFIFTDSYRDYCEKMKQRNNEKRAKSGKPPVNSYRPTIFDESKKVIPGQYSKYSHNTGSPTIVECQNIKSKKYGKQVRLLTPEEFGILQGWPVEYLDMLRGICNDRALYRAYLGGMCYTWLLSFFREFLFNFVEFNGKLESDNFSKYIDGVMNNVRYKEHIKHKISTNVRIGPCFQGTTLW